MPYPTSFTPTVTQFVSSIAEIAALEPGRSTFQVWGNFDGTPPTVTYSFPGWGASWGVGDSLVDGFSPFTAQQRDTARIALAQWGAVANIKWVEVADTPVFAGDVRFGNSSVMTYVLGNGVSGAAYLPEDWSGAGDVWINPDSSSYLSIGLQNLLLHEIGHALGLKHPFDSDGAQLATLPTAYDTSQYTVMSYTTSDYYPISPLAAPSTPMVLDIRAIQAIYGPNLSTRTGNDLYEFSPSTKAPVVETLWDAGGNDTISAQWFSNAVSIDLQEGHYSSIAIDRSIDATPGLHRDWTPLSNNIGIAYGVTIENAIGGAGNDTLLGNAANNVFTGNAGGDLIDGGAGTDTAVFHSNRANSQLQVAGTEWTVRTTTEGVDTLRNVERLQFNDVKVALDLNGVAGEAAKLIGVVFGAQAVGNAQLEGVAISLLDQGWTDVQLAEAAMQYAGKTSHWDVVSQLWANLGGGSITAEQAAPYVAMLDQGMRVGTLTMAAANLDLNTSNIHLVGLSQTGLEYL